ncbi:hypothetical protein KIW84_032733 [Lathyrus oleraceus]|uniref:Uncharacterized protein n=1 Tax=Pisum sativum TaxID=3888 RepID=A0A9D4XZC7_PEA|nr:hypothetical protein KIW84_032733 [Pisum sativum]
MALRRQLGQLQMEPNETVAQFLIRLTILTNQMKSCGKAVTGSMKVERDGVKKYERETEKALFTQSQKKGSGSNESWKRKGKGKWKSNKNEGGDSKQESQKK